MTTTPAPTGTAPDRGAARSALEVVLVALATAATWLAWLGMDDETWAPRELLGCAITLALLLAAVQVLGAGPVVSSFALTLTFVGVATYAMSRPTPGEFNFWPIASMMLLVALTLGCLVISLVVAGARRVAVRRRRG